MGATGRFEFDHGDHERIYEYVDQEEPIEPERLQQAVLPQDPGGFRHHIAIMKRNGFLERTVDGNLRIPPGIEGEKEEFTRDGIEFQVRPARQTDMRGIIGVIRQVAEQRTYIVAESVAQELDHGGDLLRRDEVESRVFFVATVNDDVVGWVHLQSPGLEKLAHTAELTVGVVAEYREHGLGSHLLERGLGWATDQDYERVYQSIPSTNESALSFLEAHGWETEAVREDHYKIDGEYVDEVMMAVEL